MRVVKKEFRTMRYGNSYAIQEKLGESGNWTTVCECETTNEAKEILRNLRALEGDEDAD